MTDAQKRQYVANLYAGKNWKRRVTKMPDDQVTAIYLKHLQDGTIDEPEEDPQEHLEVPAHPPHHNEDEFHTY